MLLILLFVFAAMLTATQVRLDMPLVFQGRLCLSAVADFSQYILSVAAYLTAGPSGSAGRDQKALAVLQVFSACCLPCHLDL